MNLIEAIVISIDSTPQLKYGKWFVECTVEAYGRKSKTSLMFADYHEAELLTIGAKVDI